MGLVAYLDEQRGLSEQRTTARRTLRLEVGVVTDAPAPAQMVIHDLSATGLLVETDDGPPVGEKLHVELPEAGSFPAKVMWSSGRFVGCKFERPLPQAAISAALLRSEPEGRGKAAQRAPVQELQARVQRQLTAGGSVAEAVSEPLAEYDRLPLHVRGRILVGLVAGSGAIWAIVLWGAGVI